MALLEDTLFVGEIAELPCDPPTPECKGYEVAESPDTGERTILESARGRILAFDVADGRLKGPRVLLDDLPVVNTEHGVNGIAAGPDGFLYVAIGHVDILWETPEVIEELDLPNADLLGTVLRVNPRTGETHVFAKGLRNVYGLTFDEEGRLFGVDNDGPTMRGWRAEELLEIREDLDYGYPFDGTFGGPEVRKGSAGISWVPHPGSGPSLLLGGAGQVIQVGLSEYEDGALGSRAHISPLATLPGFITSIDVLEGDGIMATVFEWDRGPALYILEEPLGAGT